MMNFIEMTDVCLGNDSFAQLELAKDEQTPQNFLEKLSCSPFVKVREAVAANPSTSKKTLDEMAYFYDCGGIREAVWKNPSAYFKTFKYVIDEIGDEVYDVTCDEWILSHDYEEPLIRKKVNYLLELKMYTKELITKTDSEEMLRVIASGMSWNDEDVASKFYQIVANSHTPDDVIQKVKSYIFKLKRFLHNDEEFAEFENTFMKLVQKNKIAKKRWEETMI